MFIALVLGATLTDGAGAKSIKACVCGKADNPAGVFVSGLCDSGVKSFCRLPDHAPVSVEVVHPCK